MSYDNFDPQDKEICEAIEAGATDETLVEQFGVDADKIAQLRGAVEAEKGGTPEEETPADGAGEASGDVEAQPAEEAPAGEGEPEAGAEAPAEAQPEGEATA